MNWKYPLAPELVFVTSEPRDSRYTTHDHGHGRELGFTYP
jgi:hypothetical protein